MTETKEDLFSLKIFLDTEEAFFRREAVTLAEAKDQALLIGKEGCFHRNLDSLSLDYFPPHRINAIHIFPDFLRS